ncbi:baseplate J/gp47 family protein [Yersinia intermedia]|uniref:Phage baseplate protein n=1 Tax=Yersinia intermedia TaxID=631 RepID=A0A209A9L1_YERIN|nr:baseplate J/gp47 family protein [Yersinia intermedia]OVZ89398.1 phage baseplate protein [Yersinia intermedia]
MAESGFNRQTLPQLITTIRSDILTRMNTDPALRRLDAEVYARVQAGAVHAVYGYLDYLARNLLPDLCDEDWLIRHANMKRCPRKSATAASGFMRWEGVTNNITVPAGVTIQDGNLNEFTSTDQATSANGVLRLPVVCSTAGVVGNIDDGSVLTLSTPISGIPSTAAADSLRGGADIEDLEVWRSRVIERWYYTLQGGADTDYVIWAKEVPGITRAWTYRHWSGTGTVGVMVANSDLVNPIPDDSIVAAAKEHIAPLSPVAGSMLTVFAPAAHVVDMSIRLTPDTSAIRFAVLAELRAMFLRDGVPEGELDLSRINEAISIATGEYKHILVSPAANITIGKAELAVLEEVTWS